MPVEIERKFLVDDDPDAWTFATTPTAAWLIRQGYLTRPGDDPEVRVRHAQPLDPATAHRDEAGALPATEAAVVRQLTTKAAIQAGEGGGVSRVEVEVDVDEGQFAELWEITAGRRIEKARTEYRLEATEGGSAVVFTVDRFRGTLAGLVLAEIEFEDAEASRAFVPPSFLATEVTDDRRFRNTHLAAATAPPAARA